LKSKESSASKEEAKQADESPAKDEAKDTTTQTPTGSIKEDLIEAF